MGGSFAHYFRVEAGEARPLAHFAVLFVVLGAGLAVGRGSANALFLSHLGVEQLPQTYALVGAGLFVASIGYAALADRMRPERLLNALLLSLAALLAAAWAGIAFAGDALAYRAYFVVFELASEFLVLHAMLYFASNFDPLQVKRLLPLGLASLQAGGMLGGAALTLLASTYGSRHAAAAWAALAILATALVFGHHARAGASRFFTPQKRGGSELARCVAQIAQGLRFTRRSSLLRFASAGVFFMVIALYCASFAAKGALAAAFPGPAELAIVFGVLSFVTGGATLLIQAFFSGKLLRRFGTRRINLVFPLTTLAALSALFLFPGVAAALGVMLNRHIVMPAIRNPGRALLFEALPDRMQGRARALSLGLVLPLALLATSGLLWLVGGAAAGALILLPGLGAAALYLYFSLRTNAAYVESMLATLRERLYLPDQQAGELQRSADARVVEELVRGVQQPDDQVAVAYARVLAAGFPDRAAHVVLQRMETAGVRTRDMLLRLVGPRLPRGKLEPLGADGADAHETSTLRQLHFGFGGERAAALIAQCLASDNPRLVACGIAGALQHDDAPLAARARQALGALLAAEASEPCLVAGLEAVRQLPVSVTREIDLHALLLHPSLRVRRLCLEAFAARGEADPLRLEPALRVSYATDDCHLRAACVRCYALLDPEARDALCIAALRDSHPAVTSAAIATLHTCSASFETLLSGWLREETGFPRSQAAVLEYLREQRALPHLLTQVAERKLGLAEAISRVLSWLDGKPASEDAPRALLRIVLRERLEQAVDLCLLALEAATHDRRLRVVRAGLRGRDRRQTARAIEALDSIDLPGLSRLPAALGAAHASRPGGSAGNAAAALAWLRERADPWVRQCAEHALPELSSAPARA